MYERETERNGRQKREERRRQPNRQRYKEEATNCQVPVATMKVHRRQPEGQASTSQRRERDH